MKRVLSRRTNQTQEAWVYSHDGPIGRARDRVTYSVGIRTDPLAGEGVLRQLARRKHLAHEAVPCRLRRRQILQAQQAVVEGVEIHLHPRHPRARNLRFAPLVPPLRLQETNVQLTTGLPQGIRIPPLTEPLLSISNSRRPPGLLRIIFSERPRALFQLLAERSRLLLKGFRPSDGWDAWGRGGGRRGGGQPIAGHDRRVCRRDVVEELHGEGAGDVVGAPGGTPGGPPVQRICREPGHALNRLHTHRPTTVPRTQHCESDACAVIVQRRGGLEGV
eukprot:1185152-Prorocentrum_minimum.AAC.1